VHLINYVGANDSRPGAQVKSKYLLFIKHAVILIFVSNCAYEIVKQNTIYFQTVSISIVNCISTVMSTWDAVTRSYRCAVPTWSFYTTLHSAQAEYNGSLECVHHM